ncbi:hypothetical protein [Kosakonia oryzae]|uniref:Uncharacterized protein n=1 Tax=Kosakonia oryzae TaxID=497725 RepID=A0ABX7PZR0_9ENTR|nr:hypothetical protein [Kosakonia oryzae]QSV12522.1 hypothetical protein AWR26_24895 [Kosakonia oryzae]
MNNIAKVCLQTGKRKLQSGGQLIASGKKIGLLTESITLIYFSPGWRAKYPRKKVFRGELSRQQNVHESEIQLACERR